MEPEQLNRDPRDRFVDMLGKEVAQYRQRGDPEGQVVEHRPIQAGTAAHQPVTPACSRMPALDTRRHAREEEQRHDLKHPRQRLEDDRFGEQIAPDENVVGDDARRHDRVSDDHCQQRHDPDDVDRTVPRRGRVRLDLSRAGKHSNAGHVANLGLTCTRELSRSTQIRRFTAPRSRAPRRCGWSLRWRRSFSSRRRTHTSRRSASRRWSTRSRSSGECRQG
jgi:hypothetical protein